MINIKEVEKHITNIDIHFAEQVTEENCEDPKFEKISTSIGVVRKFINQYKKNSDDESIFDIRTCKECGCTDLHACPGGCHWVTDDLCSNCVYKIVVDKGYKAHAGTYYQGIKIVIAEEVLTAEEVDAMMYGYTSALGFEHWYDEWNDEVDDIGKGSEVIRFDIIKGEEIKHVYYFKKQ